VRNTGDAYQPQLGIDDPFVNKGLFADNFLKERLSDLPEWTATDRLDESLRAIQSLYREKAARLSRSSEPQTEREFIRPILDILWGEEGPGDCYEVQSALPNVDSHRWPDFAFFRSAVDRQSAKPLEGTLEYWHDAPCLGDAKKWSGSLDKQRGVAENPSTQIVNYLYRSRVRWGILTNGRVWRLYEREKSSPGGVYYEVNLEDILRRGDIRAFRYFYLFFRRQAFLLDDTGTTFVEKVFQGSVDYAAEVGNRLKDSVYDALRLLMNGFFEHPANEVGRADAEIVKLVHANSLIVLYRLLFLLYAEDKGLLPLGNEVYCDYSLKRLHQGINQRLRAGRAYLPAEHRYWPELMELFELIDNGLPHEGRLIIPAYNGGLFSPSKYPHIAHTPQAGTGRWEIGDHRLAEVIDMLAYCREKWDQPGDQDIDYKTLDVQHLGSIYESLLELQPHVADEPMVEVLEDGKSTFKPRGEVTEPRPIRRQTPRSIAEGEVYLLTNRGERKATGSYYTPKYIVDYIVENTTGPLADEAAKRVGELRPEVDKEIKRLERSRKEWMQQAEAGDRDEAERHIADLDKAIEERKRRLLEPYLSLKVLDPAMGSGHFLVGAADFLSLAMATDPNLLPPETADSEDPQAFYKRLVVEHCLYGVDLNPLAVELAKLSLWLHTVSKDKALSFLDHHLRCGNSLIGARIEDLNKEPPHFDERGRLRYTVGKYVPIWEVLSATHLQYFLDTFRKIVETPTGDAETERIKDGWYREMDARRDKFRAVANCWLASYFGVLVTPHQYQHAVEALRGTDDDWRALTKAKWFEKAQKVARDRMFFHWELEFPEAFFEAHGFKPEEARGFDVVIGNPPYGARFDHLESVLLRIRYPHISYRTESYVGFMEMACGLCRMHGRSSMIVPDNWMYLDFTEGLRKGLMAIGAVERAVALPAGVFPDATVDTSIYVHSTLPGDAERPPVYTVAVPKCSKEGPIQDQLGMPLPVSDWETWPQTILNPYLSAKERRLVSRCRDSSVDLREVATVNYGLKAYQIGKGKPKQTAEVVESKPFTSRLRLSPEFHPFLEGSEILRFECTWDGDNWITWGEWLAEPRRIELFQVPRLLFRKVVGNRLVGTRVDELMFSNTLLYVIRPASANQWSASALLAVLNSSLIGFCFRSIFAIRPDDTFPQILLDDLQGLPIRRTAFTTPPDERERLVIEGKQLCDNYISAGDSTRTLEFVQEQLAHTPERADVVHDLLAHLAERMIAMNKEKQAEIKGFLMWLERYIGAEIGSLGGKTKIKEYHDGDFQSLLNTLCQNRRKLAINPETRTAQEEIEREFNTGMAKLTPLKEKIAATDRLIDLIVYRLYGLTDEEIKIVEGEQNEPAGVV